MHFSGIRAHSETPRDIINDYERSTIHRTLAPNFEDAVYAAIVNENDNTITNCQKQNQKLATNLRSRHRLPRRGNHRPLRRSRRRRSPFGWVRSQRRQCHLSSAPCRWPRCSTHCWTRLSSHRLHLHRNFDTIRILKYEN